MYKLFINGKTYTAEEDKKLLPFLRDDLHLTAAKDGCSEGVWRLHGFGGRQKNEGVCAFSQ